MRYEKEALAEISFPVGGIGAGCIGLAGNGGLVDWEIFNRPAKGIRNGYTHFAVRAEKENRIIAAKVVQGDMQKDFCGTFAGKASNLGSFGFSADINTLCGFPHFRHCSFDGFFPAAEITFSDPGFPAEIKLSAWSPFVPGDSATASMPCAIFRLALKNTSEDTLKFSCGGILCNPWREKGAANEVRRANGLTRLVMRNNLPEEDLRYGNLAIATDAEDVSFQEYFYRGSWQDHFEVYWHDWTTPGPLPLRRLPPRSGEEKQHDAGILAGNLTLKPGESGEVRFVISWFVPNCENYWSRSIDKQLAENGLKQNRWRNYYASLCSSAEDAAEKIFARFEEIRDNVFRFRDAMRSSSIPEAAREGASANLAVLVSPTCLRLESGAFWGWEGVGPERGSCRGSCQHVWNYAQALPLLFPDLERSMRELHAKYGFAADGAWDFRVELPEGIRAPRGSIACVDGSFGEVMKIYREWKISGDTEWLKRIYPAVRKVFAYAWSPDVCDRWDPERSGVLTGRQHNTLDVEMFGPSGWLEGFYLGALKAASEIAETLGDRDFARECADLYRRGRSWTEKNLFNGEYYIQKVDFRDSAYALQYLRPDETEENFSYIDREHGQIKYQFADGCEIDSHIGAWFAGLYGIGEILDPGQVRATLNAIVKNNYIPNMRDHANTWRVFAMNDEAGTIMCSWPAGTDKPVIPLAYASETMSGFEWAVAAHLVRCGETEKGTMLARAIRDRYDGKKRNPWNEIECGSNYARSMASFAMFQAFSGFSYDMTRGRIGFEPAVSGDFRCFWSLGTVWGEYIREGGEQRIAVLFGSALFRELGLRAGRCLLRGGDIPVCMTERGLCFAEPCRVGAGDVLILTD